MCFGMTHVVLCKSHDVEIVHDAGGAFNMGTDENGCVGGKKGYIHSSSCDFLVQFVRYGNFDEYLAFCCLTKTKWSSNYLTQPPGTS